MASMCIECNLRLHITLNIPWNRQRTLMEFTAFITNATNGKLYHAPTELLDDDIFIEETYEKFTQMIRGIFDILNNNGQKWTIMKGDIYGFYNAIMNAGLHDTNTTWLTLISVLNK